MMQDRATHTRQTNMKSYVVYQVVLFSMTSNNSKLDFNGTSTMNILQTVQDRDIITTEYKQELTHALYIMV